MSSEPARYYTVTHDENGKPCVEEREDTRLGRYDSASFKSRELANRLRDIEEGYPKGLGPGVVSRDSENVRRLLEAAETVRDQLWDDYRCRPALTPDSPSSDSHMRRESP